MKRIFTAVIAAGALLLFSMLVAAANQWTLCASSSTGGKLYYAKSSLKKVKKGIFRVSNKFEYTTKQEKQLAYAALKKVLRAPRHAEILSYDLSVNEIDCVNNTYRSISCSFHDVKGKTIYSMMEPDKSWRAIVPGSFMDELRKTICNQHYKHVPGK